ncbi:hypothetical protein O3M35_009346 [Rhynocoris fuscipes]|uniref:Kazal-like domain-containing protein n=1 Tax=Rhynocoris fuscipes TaxID=488301 RepID=A0AAW1D650_9HEMI
MSFTQATVVALIVSFAIITLTECLPQDKIMDEKLIELPICTNAYIPVCGKMGNNMKTFRNTCEMVRANKYKKENWIILSKGECPKEYIDNKSDFEQQV